MSTALDQARTAYLDAVRARLDADAAVVAAAVAWRKAEREGDPSDAGMGAWRAARRASCLAVSAEQTALYAYERELYAATYGHDGRP